jgi:hypothetical protein
MTIVPLPVRRNPKKSARRLARSRILSYGNNVPPDSFFGDWATPRGRGGTLFFPPRQSFHLHPDLTAKEREQFGLDEADSP